MNNRKAFTLVELVTVVIIIAILLGILLPSVVAIRTKAKETAQKAQLNTIGMALEAFKQDYGDYPPSYWFPPLPTNYCGAQKLSEALLGWDLMGFNPNSKWQADGTDGAGTSFYTLATLQDRKGPYLEPAAANVFRLGKLFNNTLPLASDTNVLCDVFKVRKTTDNDSTGKPITAGAPILYYKANIAYKTIDDSDITHRIYSYSDNSPIIQLGKLTANGNSGLMHPFAYLSGMNYPVFYNTKYPTSAPYIPATYGGSGIGYGIRDPRIPSIARPYNPDTYILISAGPDGYYGTADDIHNY
ncbi:MAG: prepilin-type N-terminal cleavage/methylation domain-containing protein [Sedimentisphaerales bacterium]